MNSKKDNIYPKDRMLPQFSVYNIFLKQYSTKKDKPDFLNNHKYLKLREGYFSLFAAKALEEMRKKEYFLFFPSDDSIGDIGFISEIKESSGEMDIIFFDVKEYQTADRKSFSQYLEYIFLKPQIVKNVYGLIIALNRDVFLSEKDLCLLKNKTKKLSRGVFIVASDPHDTYNVNKGLCSYFLNGHIIYHSIMEISNKNNDEIIIYEDKINYNQ